MQVHRQPFLVNVIELTSKKTLVRPKVADKAKATTSVILTSQISHKEELFEKLQTGRLTSSEASQAKVPD
jgi:hypothetical protein